MKILHVTFWPGPPFSGLNVNCYNFLKRLTPRHRARIVVVTDKASRLKTDSEALIALGILHEEVRVIRHRSASPWDRYAAALSSRSLPYLAFWEKTIGPSLRASVASIISDWKPDSLVVWSWVFAEILKDIRSCFRILYACDSVSLANDTAMTSARNLVRKAYHGLMAKRCRAFEQSVLALYDHVIFISRRDACRADLPDSVPVSVIANGVDTSVSIARRMADTSGNTLLFHGNFAFGPNLESLDFLMRTLGPALAVEFGSGGFEIRVFGSGVTHEHRSYAGAHPWLRFYGYVEDVLSELASGTVYIAPVAMGAGVKNKVLDAMNCGLPVVGTPEAFSGLDVTPGIHCVVCPRDRMLHEVVQLFRDSKRRSEVGLAGRKWVVENLSWDRQADLFDAILRQASCLNAD